MSKEESLARSAATIMIASFIGKMLGFLRELLIAAKFGAGYETDVYVIVITATMFLSSLIGGALNNILVPVLISIEEKQGKSVKIKYVNNILNIVVLLSLSAIVILWIFSPLIIKVFANGFEGDQFDLAVNLNRTALPMITFSVITCVFSGLLQSNHRFLAPASIGISLNVVYILYLLIFGYKFGLRGLIIASVLAYLSQVLIQLPSVEHIGYKYSIFVDFKDNNIRKALKLSLPVFIGLSAQQINIVVDRTMSSGLPEGSISSLNYAAFTSQIFTEVFIMAIITAIFPLLSKAFNDNNIEKLKKIMIEGSKLIALLTLPATVGMILLAKPIIQFIFQRGAFDINDTLMTSQAFIYYCVAMTFTGLKRLLLKVFYSLEDSKTPMINGLIEVAINIILNIILVPYMAHKGLAFATSVAATVTYFTLLYSLKKKIGTIKLHNHLSFFIKIVTASAFMCGVVYLTMNILTKYYSSSNIVNLFLLGICIFAGIITYLIACVVLKVKEISTVLKLVKQKLLGISIDNI